MGMHATGALHSLSQHGNECDLGPPVTLTTWAWKQMGSFSSLFEPMTLDSVPLFRAKTQATAQNFMKLVGKIINNEIRLLMQTFDKGLVLTSTSHDRHFIKHIINMKSTSHNNRSKHMDLILI